LKDARWTHLRGAVRRAADFTCEICEHRASEESGVGVEVHEDWHYDDAATPATRTLARIGCLCRLCHQVHHIGLWQSLVASGKVPQQLLDDVIAHFCRVNECDLTAFEQEKHRAFELMESRLTIPYEFRWGRFGVLLGRRVEQGDYSILHAKGMNRPENEFPIPWIGEIPMPMAVEGRIVHIVPLFGDTNRRGATKHAVITALLPLEQDLNASASQAASAWIGKTYAEFAAAAHVGHKEQDLESSDAR
jgi:hypothetical protein